MNIEKIYNQQLDEKFFKVLHPSGLEIIVIPKKYFAKKYAFFTTKYGSLYNQYKLNDGKVRSKPPGIAHFLEHKIFENSTQDIFEEFAKLGADVNAFTNFDSTTYTFHTIDNFYKSLNLLLDFVQNPHITEENVEKEKGIIEQEINMYNDDPQWRVYFNVLRGLYKEHPIRTDIAGTVDSIQKITKKDLMECYESFYTPKNMNLVISGDIDLNETIQMVDQSLTSKYVKNTNAPEIILPKVHQQVYKKRWHETMDVARPLIDIGFKDVKEYSHQELFKRGLAIKIVLNAEFGPSSEFYQKIYERGLVFEPLILQHSFSENYSFLVISATSAQTEVVEEKIINRIHAIQENGFSMDDFIRIKRKFIGHFISSFNSIRSMSRFFVSYKNKNINIFDYLDVLESIDYEYAMKVFKSFFDNAEAVISTVGGE